MAWQTPKTNWGAADSVRDTDFNRIEGNILELYNTSAARADFNLYVNAETGNDSTGTGTSAAPYKTIMKALSAIPKHVDGRTVSISVASGTYNEVVALKGYTSPIIISGGYNSQVYIDSFVVEGCHCILDTIHFFASGAVLVTNGGRITGDGRFTVQGSSSLVTVTNGGQMVITALARHNAGGYAISVDSGSRVHVGYFEGAGSANGILCQSGSVVSFTSNNMTVTGAMYQTYAGGRIYSGSQDSPPEY